MHGSKMHAKRVDSKKAYYRQRGARDRRGNAIALGQKSSKLGDMIFDPHENSSTSKDDVLIGSDMRPDLDNSYVDSTCRW